MLSKNLRTIDELWINGHVVNLCDLDLTVLCVSNGCETVANGGESVGGVGGNSKSSGVRPLFNGQADR